LAVNILCFEWNQTVSELVDLNLNFPVIYLIIIDLIFIDVCLVFAKSFFE